ncbi:MAG: M28 family peptidase [Flavobacteriales bacterium]|nr:M28 family peptidase [Flavobacteriales bacterium]
MKASKDRLYKHVEFLTELRPFRNCWNFESLEKVCTYIKQEFNEIGVSCKEQVWKARGNDYKNIIATYNPAKKQRLIVGAHYDVCGNQAGADDNASAVAGMLEAARMVFENKPDFDYRIDFVAYCLEEPPFFGTQEMGSYVHAKSLHDEGAEVMGMICYEMIGYFSDEPNSQPFPIPGLDKIYPTTANFIIVVGTPKYHDFNVKVHELMKEGAGIDVQMIDMAEIGSLAGLSDQQSYWQFDYPALMINDTSFVRNPNYHEETDTIDTLDFDKMTEVVNASYKAIAGF